MREVAGCVRSRSPPCKPGEGERERDIWVLWNPEPPPGWGGKPDPDGLR